MCTGRLVPWLAIRVFVVAAGIIGVWLFVSGVVLTTPLSAGSFPVADSFAPTASSAELTVSPASSVAQGTAVTLRATVSRPTAAGTVQFKDGATYVGAPVRVSNGTASQTTSMLATGSHRLTAVFTPTAPMTLGSSTSPAMALTVTGPDGNGPLPAIAPQQTSRSVDSPAPNALDNQVSAALDNHAPAAVGFRVPTVVDNRAPTALDIQMPSILDNQTPSFIDVRVPTLLDNQASSVLNVRVPTLLDNQPPSLLDVRVPGVVNLRVPTASDNRMPSNLDGRQRTSTGSGTGRWDADRSMTSCHHYKCGSLSKCGSSNAMTSEPQQQPGQNNTGQNNTGQNNTGQNNTGQNNTGQNNTGQNNTGG
jgi:hypothetical protein